MTTPTFRIPTSGPGALLIGPRPDAAALVDSVAAWKAAGVDSVLSLLDGEELRDLGLATEAAECRRQGLTYLNQPTVDFSVPTEQALNRIAQTVMDRMRDGGTVLVHCRAGIGRSGMTACAVLIRQGNAAEAAIATVSDARGRSVPDTAEQAALLHRFAAVTWPTSRT